MLSVPVEDLTDRAAEVIDLVVAGRTVVLTRDQVPVAEIRPVATDSLA